MGFVAVIALDPVGIGSDIIRQSLLIQLGGAILALAPAFGPGGEKWAAAMFERLGSTRIGKKED
jgi:cystathionine beta-lyase family protein involved in aluminum resistance